jgi:hypothetical protein
MKDFTGKEVKVGDYIFYSTTSRYAESRICQVTRFSPKGSIFGELVSANRTSYRVEKREEVIIKNSFVILSDYEEVN